VREGHRSASVSHTIGSVLRAQRRIASRAWNMDGGIESARVQSVIDRQDDDIKYLIMSFGYDPAEFAADVASMTSDGFAGRLFDGYFAAAIDRRNERIKRKADAA
jgi:hypothetical protein